MQLRDAQESHSIFDLPSYLLWLNFVSKCVRSTPDSPCSYTHPPTSSFRTVYPPRSSLNATSYASDMCDSGGDSEVQRTMLELLNQLDGFESTKNIKVRQFPHLQRSIASLYFTADS